MQRMVVWIACAASCCALIACSASAPAGSRGAPIGVASAGKSGSAGVSAAISAPSPGTPGNSDGDLVVKTTPPPPAAVAGSGGMPALPNGPVSIDQTGSDNPAKLSPQDVQALIAGGSPGSLRWLYPYEATVFRAACSHPC